MRVHRIGGSANRCGIDLVGLGFQAAMVIANAAKPIRLVIKSNIAETQANLAQCWKKSSEWVRNSG